MTRPAPTLTGRDLLSDKERQLEAVLAECGGHELGTVFDIVMFTVPGVILGARPSRFRTFVESTNRKETDILRESLARVGLE